MAAEPVQFPEHGVFTTIEAAAYLRVSRQFLEIGRTRGGGPSFCKFSRAVRYRRVDLDAWLASTVVNSTAAAAVRDE